MEFYDERAHQMYIIEMFWTSIPCTPLSFVNYFFQSKVWDHEQMAALNQAAYRKFGSSISQWPVKALETIKQLLAGFEANELAKLVGDVFDQG